MRRRATFALALLLVCAATGGVAAPVPSSGEAREQRAAIAFDRIETATPHRLLLRSEALAGGQVPDWAAGTGGSTVPDLAWSPLPPRARSLAIIVEDGEGVRDGTPVVHWIAWDIDPQIRAVPKGWAALPMVEGVNVGGRVGYAGPRPRAGVTRPYHFQLFALDKRLDLASGATRQDLLAAMQGHVVAKGQLIARYTGQ
jgi:Raf kinase inhibitor-like YbhB/YbcL family protein